MYAPARVAALAVLYRACQLNHHRGPESVLEDLSSCSGEVSLATLEASRAFKRVDWEIVAVLDRPEHVLATARALLQQDDPLRAEAMMHALPPHGRRSRKQWAASFVGRRWHKVERAMRELEAEGVAASRDDVESVAVNVYRTLTGKSYEDYMDEYEDLLLAERADA
jgi:hypothetical protein